MIAAMRIGSAFLVALATSGECRFLAPTGAPPADVGSIEDQIAALNAQIAASKADIVASGGTVEPDDSFVHHCKPEAKAALDKASDVPVVEKKEEDGLFAAQMEASDRKQLVDNEEFLLGLLIMHQTRHNWSYEQELDAICDLAKGSVVITKLYKHHTRTEPMSAQLARMMDEERKLMKPTSAPPLNLENLSAGGLIKRLTENMVTKK
mmetsp:Transcript_68892/g.175038  ORF Transcript_68892/g.175038 Transcript_68892/m.175038 type:complete len:208 (+) Transcript_68892:51-674(+)